MRGFLWRLTITFILAYMLLVGALLFAYTTISERFIANKAQESLELIHLSTAERLNISLEEAYDKFREYILTFDEQGLDPISELKAIKHKIKIGEQNYVDFGLYDEENEVFDFDESKIYDFYDSSEIVHYNQNINVYLFDNELNKFRFAQDNDNYQENLYVFFKYNEVVGYFDANTYFSETLKEMQALNSKHFLITQDKHIFYQPALEINATSSRFLEYLRVNNSNRVVNRVNELIDDNQIAVVDLSLFGVSTWMAISPLNEGFSTRGLVVVSFFPQNDALVYFSELNLMLLAVFVVIFVLFAFGLLLLFRIIQQKNNDIENARLTHYYAKPYIIRINSRGIIKSYNKSFKNFLGDYDVYEKVSDFTIRYTSDENVLEDIIRKQKGFTATFVLGVRSVYVRFIPVRSGGGYLLLGDDVTEIEGNYDFYHKIAMTSESTELPNDNQLQKDLDDLFSKKKISKSNNSLIAFNITTYSKLKMLLGEQNVDRMIFFIKELVLESLIGYPATLYHTDVDRFVVLLKDIESYQWAMRWVQKLVELFADPIAIEKNLMDIEIRIGVFHMDSTKYVSLTAKESYENLALSLNHAMESSQHKYFVYDVGLSQIASRKQMMQVDLANAIKNQEFYMVYQPQYNNDEERIIGFEALIRWNNPKYHDESPLVFIELAEKNNMIIDIGRIVLHETFMMAKEFEAYNVKISINISPVQILHAGFVNEIIEIFEQYDLKKKSICLEVTETFLISSMDLVIEKLRLLKKYGFEIHLDDFGTGYSSLQYLNELPINTIKIDREFIKNIDTDANSRAIVSMITSLAKGIGLSVIAEGVEDEKQNQWIYRQGCSIIQGYLLSRPVVKEKALEIIEEYNIKKTKKIHVQKTTKARR
ncbi:MAG: GGDEF domain-containing phosphodiesterase [Acholeplasmataceae bacterium]